MVLCDKCAALDLKSAIRRLQHTKGSGRPDDDESGWIYGWHERPTLVYGSGAAAGCDLCRFVTRGWEEYRATTISRSIRDGLLEGDYQFEDLHASILRLTAYQHAEIDTVVLRLERAIDGRQKWSYALRVACRPPETEAWDWQIHRELFVELKIAIRPEFLGFSGVPWDGLELDTTVDKQPTSASSLAVVRGWLRTCTSSHEKCRQPEKHPAVMPSRFLDVANPNAMDRVFLMIRGEDTPAGVQYVALSHCWGKVKTIHTTRSSVDLHRSGIDIQALPQTFQDAIQTTRALGLRYMWIDSLCIVQDDARDWEAEAARMADVYRNAHLVLGATRADADVAGFLGPRPTPTHSTALGAFRLTLLPPLLERWTQGADLAGWECAELRASEDGDAILDQGDRLFRVLQTANTGVSVFGQVVSSAWANADSLLRSESRHKYSGWYELVSHYSTREITKDTDRLPALLGIASALGVVTGDDYLYGAWHGGLLEGLTWCPGAKGGLSRPEKPIAPSWSWASVKGKVEFPIYAWYELCESDTEQTALIPVARYTIQDASRGIIRLQAPIVRVATWQPRQGHVNPPDDPTSDFRESLVTDTVFQLYPRQYGDPTGCAWWLDGAFDTRPDPDSRDDELHVAFLTRLPYVQANRIYEHVLGLVIRKSSDSTSYERLGFVDSWVQETRGNMVSMVEGPDKLFAEVHGSKHPLQRVSDVLHAAIAEIELA